LIYFLKRQTKLFEIKSEKNRSRGGEFRQIPGGEDDPYKVEAKLLTNMEVNNGKT